jgi:hypothetical protein
MMETLLRPGSKAILKAKQTKRSRTNSKERMLLAEEKFNRSKCADSVVDERMWRAGA